MIKYSILIPARNGGKYLPTCVDTIISQDFDDYELIISDDHSTDDSSAYLSTVDHPNINVIYPPVSMSMTEHWEWVLSHACGEWLMFVGQDDGLLPYFFELAERLTEYAAQKKIRTIMSERSYFFWPGCETLFGDIAVSYSAVSQLAILNCKIQALLSLFGFQPYFKLPEMYTSSLFHRSIIDEVKKRQNGKVFTTHPQDANLGAIACSLENHYLKSGIPLGWIGTSPKSAGIAIVAPNGDTSSLKQEYLKKITNSKLPYHPLAGDFSLGSPAVYFWGALLQTQHLRRKWINRLLMSKKFKTLMFAGVFEELTSSKVVGNNDKISMFEETVNLNQCNLKLIYIISNFFRILYKFKRLNLVIKNRLKRLFKPAYFYKERWRNNPDISMVIASEKIKKMVVKNRMIEKLK